MTADHSYSSLIWLAVKNCASTGSWKIETLAAFYIARALQVETALKDWRL